MAPREANNPFADQYLSIEYDATTMMLPHDIGLGNVDDEEEEPEEEQEEEEQVADPQGQLEHDDDHDENPIVGHPTRNHGILSPATTAIHLQQQQQQQQQQQLQSPHFNDDGYFHLTNPPVAADLNTPATNATTTTTMHAPIATGFNHVPTNHYNHGSGSAGDNPVGGRGATQPLPFEVHVQSTEHSIAQQQRRRRGHDPPFPIASSPSHGSDVVQDVDPLAIDMSDPEEQDAWNLYLDAAIASASENCILHTSRNTTHMESSPQARVRERSQTASFPSRSFEFPTRRRATSDGISSMPNVRRSFPQDASGAGLSQHPRTNRIQRFSRRRVSLLDQDPSMSCSEDEQDGLPDLDTTHDESAATTTSGQDLDGSEVSSPPGTPHFMSLHESGGSNGSPATRNVGSAMSSSAAGNRGGGLSLVAPVRRMFRGETNLFHSSNTNAVVEGVNVVSDEDNTSSGSSFTTQNPNNVVGSSTMMMEHPTTPRRFVSSSTVRSISALSTGSGPSIHWNGAFDSGSTGSSANHNDSDASSVVNSAASFGNDSAPSPSPTQLNLSFGPHTTITDLKYFAERGCIVPLLGALDTPRLKTMGARMLADYAKLPHRRVAVASNKRILEFCCRTMLELPTEENMGTDWPAREYAVEAIRSLTATEDSDGYLMKCNGLLKSLAVVARGGPFGTIESLACQMTPGMGLVSGKARLHACIAIMNLSCGKANKIEIASIPEVLEAMRDVMMAQPENFSPATSSQVHSSNGNVTPKNVAAEARLKAATCIKNLSNADKNDAALLNADGLLEALAHVAVISCSGEKGATNCTTNACLALMNLSISKANKHKVFKTPGVMNALMEVLERTSPRHGRRGEKNDEARIKACSALSNLAIGYENKIPMFNYPGFVGCILDVIQTDSGEARTKACSILWSFAAEMKNQVPVVQRGDILPVLVRVAAEDHSTEARFKCVAALTLLAESLDNAMPLLESGALHPLMDILHDAGPDPTQWKGQTASWCVGFLMNMSQSDEAAPYLREAGVVELLAPLLTLDHYQSLKAAMAVTFVCRYDEDDETYDLLRKTENVIPKIINLLHNTLAGMGGSGYKYGVFTLRSSVGCISSLASGPEFMKERISTRDVFESLLRVVSDFCVDGGTDGAIVGGGRDDAHSATLAIRALQALTEYLIPIPGSSALPFGATMDSPLMTALDSFASCTHPGVADKTRELAKDAFHRIQSSLDLSSCPEDSDSGSEGYSRRRHPEFFIENSIVASLVQGCCIGPSLQGGFEDSFFPSMIRTTQNDVVLHGSNGGDEGTSQLSGAGRSQGPIRTFLLTDARTGRRFAVPTDPSGGRAFNDGRLWCYRRGRFCKPGEIPDPDYQWNEDLQNAYLRALGSQQEASSSTSQSRLNNSGSGASQIQSQRIPYV